MDTLELIQELSNSENKEKRQFLQCIEMNIFFGVSVIYNHMAKWYLLPPF